MVAWIAFAAVASEIDNALEGVHKMRPASACFARAIEAGADGKGGGRRMLFMATPPKPTGAA